jgi:hypothetical protein
MGGADGLGGTDGMGGMGGSSLESPWSALRIRASARRPPRLR